MSRVINRYFNSHFVPNLTTAQNFPHLILQISKSKILEHYLRYFPHLIDYLIAKSNVLEVCTFNSE